MRSSYLKGLCVGMLSAGLVTTAQADNPASTNTTSGQGLQVTITAPAGPVVLGGSAVDVSSNAILGAPPPRPVNIIYVTDLSNSMSGQLGQGIEDCNHDGRPDTRMDAACLGLIALNQALGNATNVDIGLVGFATDARSADMSSTDGMQLFTTPPDVDGNSDGVSDVEEVIRSLRYRLSGQPYSIGKFTPIPAIEIDARNRTDFEDALRTAQNAFDTQPPGEKNIVVLISDGQQTEGDYRRSLAGLIESGTTVYSFAIGPTATAECQLDKPLGIIASDTGGSCTLVLDPSTLQVVLPEVLTTRIQSLDIVVNGVQVASNSGSDANSMSVTGDVSGALIEGFNLVFSTARTEDGSEVTAFVVMQAINRIAALIDIKPGSYPNSINRKNKGVITVAVFGSEELDTSTIVPESVVFAGVGIAPRQNGTLMYSFEDVNNDGMMDFVTHFRTQEVTLADDATSATLTGQTTDGVNFEGSDSVRIVH